MRPVKILHMADFHIGYKYAFLKELSSKRQLEALRSLRELAIFSNLENIDLVLIAGDFLEASTISGSFVGEVKSILAEFSARIFVVAGNHDYISIGSHYLDEDWPDNVHIFKSDKIEKVYLEDLNTCVFGASFTSSYQRRGFLKDEITIDRSCINIGLIHGDALFQADELYNQITKEEIERWGFDYLALGHIHKKSGILKAGDTNYAYPGSPISLGFAEQGPREVILGEISKDISDFSYYQLKQTQFLEELVDISGLYTETQIADKTKAMLKEKYDDYYKHYYRLRLIGHVDENLSLDLGLLASKLSDLEYLEIIDDSSLKLDLDLLRKENSLRGSFVNKILNRQEEAKAKGDFDQYMLLKRSMELTLRVFEGREI